MCGLVVGIMLHGALFLLCMGPLRPVSAHDYYAHARDTAVPTKVSAHATDPLQPGRRLPCRIRVAVVGIRVS